MRIGIIRMIMNNVVGIVAEFNPIHYGHCYLIEEARKRTSADGVACVMSGNFVQRGAPAVFDKWTRTEMALSCGADLVVEIPTVFCLGNASVYARAAVKLMEGMGGITHIAFGSEIGCVEELRQIATALEQNKSLLEKEIAAEVKNGRSYPAARQAAVERRLSINLKKYAGPNDTLALEYLRNLSSLEPVALKRIHAGYHDSVQREGNGAEAQERLFSSTAVREQLSRGLLHPGSVPWNMASFPNPMVEEEPWFDLIRYAVLSQSVDDLETAPGGGEGLGNRLKEAVRTANSLSDLVQQVKSKRYTYTRISRWLYQILLGIRRGDQYADPEYVRILGFNDRGRELIRHSKKNSLNSISFIDNINKQPMESTQLELDLHGADIYNLACGNSIRRKSDYCRQIIIK